MDNIRQIYFAGGCFWGTEHFFKLITGVTDTETGYANSLIPDPTYKEVCTGATNAAETVCVQYDSQQISLRELILPPSIPHLSTGRATTVERNTEQASTIPTPPTVRS